ncbi:MAG: hypothetical protein ABS76_11745 [Pelagibacterium sp. SCN 64-44]|nr:MAG: hypothetical protein ABS76_11745 [Pelagibacterium sp. SCN 64-44]
MMLVLAMPARAEDAVGVVLTSSEAVVLMHPNFSGEVVTLFGAIDPPRNAPASPYSVLVIVQGPRADWVVREKTRQLGLVLNSAAVQYEQVPSYFGIFSSGPRDGDEFGILAQRELGYEGLVGTSRIWRGGPQLDSEFIRLMERDGRFVQRVGGTTMHSPTAFSVRVRIASSAFNGTYIARALVIAGGEVVGETTTHFRVRTQGLERFMEQAARDNSALYGLATIILALVTGWLGGVLFKR